MKLPDPSAGVGRALAAFVVDANLHDTPLPAYAKNVTNEVIAVGRAGSLVDWEGGAEQRAYAVLYRAEQIINWRTGRVNGRNVLTLVVLREVLADGLETDASGDEFESKTTEQYRVLKLVEVQGPKSNDQSQWQYVVEIWRQGSGNAKRAKAEWTLAESRTPLRLGKPLPLIPFVFHGPRHALPDVEKPPMADIIAINLDHYRLNADYKHGLHFTALPTARGSGFDKSSSLRIGSSTAWVAETPGAT